MAAAQPQAPGGGDGTLMPGGGGGATTLRLLVGSGDKIGLCALPFLLVGVVLNVVYPSAFRVGGPPSALRVVSILALIAGVTIWIWSVVLIVTKVPRGELITSGPYRLVTHPLYTGVALLVLPWVGFLCNTWLGAAIGIVLYLGSRRFAPEEEAALSQAFGPAWDDLPQDRHDPLAIGRTSSADHRRPATVERSAKGGRP